MGVPAGVVRTLYNRGRLGHCYFTETRPYNQGARLTAVELLHDRIPSTLICDNMVAAAMSRRGIDAVVTGADRCSLLPVVCAQCCVHVCNLHKERSKGREHFFPKFPWLLARLHIVHRGQTSNVMVTGVCRRRL